MLRELICWLGIHIISKEWTKHYESDGYSGEDCYGESNSCEYCHRKFFRRKK